jgi:tropomyosin
MNSLRLEQEETQSKYEEVQAKVKVLEQENLAKEQEITSLSHKNQLLEAEVEKLEKGIKEAKAIAEQGSQAGTQNESLQRRLQLLEEEAEESDRQMRETNEKYGHPPAPNPIPQSILCTITEFLLLQVASNRRQGWPFRAQGPSIGGRS